MPAKVTINIDQTGETARIKEAGNKALTDVRDDIIKDINLYVPVGGGKAQNGGGSSLRESAKLHSDKEAQNCRISIRWDTPYAQYQNKGKVMHGTPKDRSYGPDMLKYTDNAARAEWEKYAEEQHGSDWELAVEARMKEYL